MTIVFHCKRTIIENNRSNVVLKLYCYNNFIMSLGEKSLSIIKYKIEYCIQTQTFESKFYKFCLFVGPKKFHYTIRNIVVVVGVKIYKYVAM